MISEATLLSVAGAALERATGLPVAIAPARPADGLIRVGAHAFIVEAKSTARSAAVAQALEQLRRYGAAFPDARPLLVVPRMGQAGAELCERANVDWVDADGNAMIRDRELIVQISGRRSPEVSDALRYPYSPASNPFSRKASRIVHALLLSPGLRSTRPYLEHETNLGKGYVSRIVAELLSRGLIEEDASGGGARELHVKDPMVLLDAWSEHYRPVTPALWGLVAARDGSDATRQVREILTEAGEPFALTGLPAAALYTRFGAYRRVDVYIPNTPSSQLMERLHLGVSPRGRNIAIRIDDANVQLGARKEDGYPLASPIITYLDLATISERAEEARDEMRRYLELQWR